jgi:myo-inositol-1(or 4)-monophosphatase
MMVAQAEWVQWCTVAEAAARDAGALLRQLLAEPRQIQSKGFRDIVTDADHAAQGLITNAIQRHFPDHGFLAEEENLALPATGPVRWLIDPVDGTSNYSRAIPNFCVSIAAAVEEQVVVGVIYDPMTDELFSAVQGRGCTLNGQPVVVSTTADLADAVVAIDWGRERAVREASSAAFLQLVHQVRTLRTIGSSALTLAWVAAGRLDAHLSYQLSAWDIAAGTLLIQEAGGRVTTVTNDPLRLALQTSCASSNGLLHKRVLDVVKRG